MQLAPIPECSEDEASTGRMIAGSCQSASGLRAVIDALPIAVMVQNERGEIFCSNKSAAAHLMMPADVVRESLVTMPPLTPFEVEGDNKADTGQDTAFQTVREHIRIENHSYL